MLKRWLAVAAVAATLAGADGASAQSVDRMETHQLSAVVQSVDPVTRQILLRFEDTGELKVIVAGPEVVNFDQIEAGDRVVAVIALGVAAEIARPGEAGTATAVVGGAAEEGEKPGLVTGTAVAMVVTFESFDEATSKAIAMDDDGVRREFDVQTEEGRAFARTLTPGDRVRLVFSESLAIGIEEQ